MIQGIGGIGKTEIAMKFAEANRDRYVANPNTNAFDLRYPLFDVLCLRKSDSGRS